MKIRKAYIGIPLLALVFVITLASCLFNNDEDEDYGTKYTVWTGKKTYSDFEAVFGELEDGYYSWDEFTDAEFSKISKTLKDKNKHSWSEIKIQDYLMNRDFDYNTAEKATTKLLAFKHGYIASRSGYSVFIIVK